MIHTHTHTYTQTHTDQRYLEQLGAIGSLSLQPEGTDKRGITLHDLQGFMFVVCLKLGVTVYMNARLDMKATTVLKHQVIVCVCGCVYVYMLYIYIYNYI